MNSANALVIALADPASSNGDADVDWWRIVDGHVVASGQGMADLPAIGVGEAGAERARIVALAPASQTVLHQPPLPPGTTPKQALAVAALAIADSGPEPAGSLHITPVISAEAGHAPRFVSVPTTAMAWWSTWSQLHDLPFDLLMPAALLLPEDPDGAVRGMIGGETIVRTAGRIFPAEPALAAVLLAPGDRITDLSAEQVERAIVHGCDLPPANLLHGKWARQDRSIGFDTRRLPLIARLVAALVIVSLAIPLTRIIMLHRDADRLDTAASAAAARVVTPAPPLDQAIARIDQRLAEMGGGPGLLTTPVAVLAQAMDSYPTVSVDSISWSGDGVLSVTLGGPRNEDINPVLESIQRNGYRITAQARAGNDGRALADITMRTTP